MDSFGMQNIVLESNILMLENELNNLIIEDSPDPGLNMMDVMPPRTFHNVAPSPYNSRQKPSDAVPNLRHTLLSIPQNTVNPQYLQNHFVSRSESVARIMSTLLPNCAHAMVPLRNDSATSIHSHTGDSQYNFANSLTTSSARTQPIPKDNAYQITAVQQADFHRKVYQEPSKGFSLPGKKTKLNKKKNSYNSRSMVQPVVDYSKVVVNLDEIGLGRNRCRIDACTRLLMKFRRLFVYLTAFSKERKLVETIVLSREIQSGTKYSLSTTASASEHLAYALESLLIEMRCVQTLSTNIQRAYDDSKLIIPYSEGVNNMYIGINMLTILSTSFRSQEIGNVDVVKVDNVLSDLIENLRFMGTFYLLTAQILLSKQTRALQGRRRMFIGN